MKDLTRIKSALISVYDKTNLEILLHALKDLNVEIYSTGGTLEYIQNLGLSVVPVESLTRFPEILGGRVKTLHPGVFGGILYQRGLERDETAIAEHDIHPIDLVVVDLYPFEKTVKQTNDHSEIIEKIDIGGVSLLRAAAKNHEDVVVVSSQNQYPLLAKQLMVQEGQLTLEQRRNYALNAFEVTSQYDLAIANYFQSLNRPHFDQGLRYGENPHQSAAFKGDLNAVFEKIAGKELSYNNLLDVDSAIRLMDDLDSKKAAFAIIKHNNACGIAFGKTVRDAYERALAADPVSAFGGVLISNQEIALSEAALIHELFFEILIAPSFSNDALDLLMQKKNRILLKKKQFNAPSKTVRTILNGQLIQDADNKIVCLEDLQYKTSKLPSEQEITDLLFANIIVKHTKSNAIVLVKNGQMLASGTGQTSRVDALRQAIEKANTFGFELQGAVMASDAFFPFPDCVEIANHVGISAVIQPGGSVKDQLSIDYCNDHNMSMVFTGYRHFKH